MSQDGNLICKKCRQFVSLGKTAYAENRTVLCFYKGKEYDPETYHVLTRILLKFLADHFNHELTVVLDEELDRMLTEQEWKQQIGGIGGVSAEEYLSGWNGWPPEHLPQRKTRWRWWT